MGAPVAVAAPEQGTVMGTMRLWLASKLTPPKEQAEKKVEREAPLPARHHHHFHRSNPHHHHHHTTYTVTWRARHEPGCCSVIL